MVSGLIFSCAFYVLVSAFTIQRNSMPHIIGFTGYKRSGKDTAASFFHEYLPLKQYRIKTFSFGFNVKKEVAANIGQTVDWVEANKLNPVIRHLLQWYGTDYAKELRGTDVWIRELDAEIAKIEEPAIVLIPDVRFLEEAAWIRRKGGVIIRVEKEGQVNDDLHQSETELDKIRADFRLMNNGKDKRSYAMECRWVVDFAKQQLKL